MALPQDRRNTCEAQEEVEVILNSRVGCSQGSKDDMVLDAFEHGSGNCGPGSGKGCTGFQRKVFSIAARPGIERQIVVEEAEVGEWSRRTRLRQSSRRKQRLFRNCQAECKTKDNRVYVHEPRSVHLVGETIEKAYVYTCRVPSRLLFL